MANGTTPSAKSISKTLLLVLLVSGCSNVQEEIAKFQPHMDTYTNVDLKVFSPEQVNQNPQLEKRMAVSVLGRSMAIVEYDLVLAEAESQPYIRGKLISVHRGSPYSDTPPRIDPLFLKLDPEIRAGTPDEVGTVAWIFNGERRRGRYENGASAFVGFTEVVLVDLRKRTLIASRTFTGDSPPEKKFGVNDFHSKPDTADIVEYLEGLRRISSNE